jgi:hypothetical protein
MTGVKSRDALDRTCSAVPKPCRIFGFLLPNGITANDTIPLFGKTSNPFHDLGTLAPGPGISQTIVIYSY